MTLQLQNLTSPALQANEHLFQVGVLKTENVPMFIISKINVSFDIMVLNDI